MTVASCSRVLVGTTRGTRGRKARRRTRNLEGRNFVAELTGSIRRSGQNRLNRNTHSVPIVAPNRNPAGGLERSPRRPSRRRPRKPRSDQTCVLDKVAAELPAAPAPTRHPNTGETPANSRVVSEDPTLTPSKTKTRSGRNGGGREATVDRGTRRLRHRSHPHDGHRASSRRCGVQGL